MISYRTPDLTRHPPRSPRVRLGGYVMLPRSIDKARAKAADQLGDYRFPNPMDQRLFVFAGVDPEAFFQFVQTGASDSEILAWFNEHGSHRRTEWEIATWSDWLTRLAPGDARRHRMFAEEIEESAPAREDLRTLMDRLDFDDYLSFGGRP